MAIYRSASGKLVDMGALISRNAKTRAVGNMKVNARGDQIDSYGRVIKSINEKTNSGYAKTVGNRSAQPVKSTQKRQQSQPTRQVVKEQMTDYEKQLSQEVGEDDLEIEKIKAMENKK